MTSFQFWQSQMAADRFICMICFEAFHIDEAYVDQSGDKWDICKHCGAQEEKIKQSNQK